MFSFKEKMIALAAAGAFLAPIGFATAQNGNMQNSNMQNGNMQNSNMQNSNMSGGNSNMSQNMMMSSQDKKFAMEAAMGGMAEVAMARVALERSQNDAIKQYAQKMIDDHTAANTELMGILSAKGMTAPTAPDAKHQMMMDRMSKMSGAQFDMMYVENAGVKDHSKMEKLFQSESTRGKDAELRAFAAKTLPVVQMHLRMAREMMTSMKGNKPMNGNMSM